ncbi:Radical SAM family protein HutW [Rhodovulum sp. PH10]|uniref:heme anaerobic degradation radical SAM methyltransferase ChuW/HutW n=1 Tax=Rhodovulum sp. PH10 TaxID=1187851 RepID=UPI00027C1DC5|nr:heme anaerobic degradation radical SAM methyltransferase ChuW/HutW [Rhodovulum sp. PH10]EJW12896.1 Radical SAM family protein HutW [Rhodovulum sp. PH10]
MTATAEERTRDESPPRRRDHPSSPPQPLAAFLVPPGRDPLTEAFSGREFAPPWRGSTPVAPERAEAVYAEILATPRKEPAIVYLHVPYCQNHCLFCGFFQNVWRPDVADAFVDDLLAEVAEKAETPLVASAPIVAVYLGGGTPTALPAKPLARLVAGLKAMLPLAENCEVTLEGRAFDFGRDKALAAFDAGVTRVSLGVQTFDTGVRKRLGRKLGGPEVAAFLAELVALDRASIVCDLMYGLPGQTHEAWAHDLDTVASLGLDGATLYALNVWRGGRLAAAIDSGRLPPAATLREQARAYATGFARLTERGFAPLAQSHLARSVRERNVYNSGIKRGLPCIPLGPGAGGQAHGHRWRNVIEIDRRRAMRAEGRPFIEGISKNPPRYPAQAAVTGGMEAGALDLSAIETLAPGFRAAAAPLVENWVAAGLGTIVGDTFATTRAGAFWLTNLTGGFFAALDAAAILAASTAAPTEDVLP